MELVICGIYEYRFLEKVALIACDIDKNEVTVKCENGLKFLMSIDDFRENGKLISKPELAK